MPQTILDCTFVNAWQAIRIGPETNECHTFRRLRICALKTGFLIDMTTDIGRITDVLVSPEVWAKSGFGGAPKCATLSAVVVSPRGTLSFSHCDISAALDASSGGRIERIANDKATPVAERLRAEFPAWPRPKGNRVLFASDFGASREAEDNTSAIQNALDEAGKGEEDGEPFITLAPKSGARGIGVWYPEQPISEPVAYPWTIRSLGPGCWLADVNLGNSWQGVDFATHPSDGHRISYVSGGFFKTGVLVGNAMGRGCVEDIQFNPHYMLRLSLRLPVNWGPKKPLVNGEHPVYPFCRRELRGIVLRDCADEMVVGTFLYAARDGISFEGNTRANVLITGVDTACRGVRLMLAKGGRVRVALGQIVPLGSDVEAAIVGDAQNRGKAAFMVTQTWPKNSILVNGGTGPIVLDQVNACGCSLPDAGSTVSTRLIHWPRHAPTADQLRFRDLPPCQDGENMR